MKNYLPFSQREQRIYQLKSVIHTARILILLFGYKVKHPYLRLGQILENIKSGKHFDLFVIEDEILLNVVKEFTQK